MKTLVSILCALLLSACANTQAFVAPTEDLYADERFGPPLEPVSTAGLFSLSPAMAAYAKKELHATGSLSTPQRRLFNALYATGQLKVEYDSTRTRTPSETFDAKSGNCLSLVLMTAAFAKALDMEVSYQNVLVEETWSRNNGFYFASSHVNITLGRRHGAAGIIISTGYNADDATAMTIDFLPPEDSRTLRGIPIDEDSILAMYMNNRAAEYLAQGKLDDAYWWARRAIAEHPRYPNAYNTLGVIYNRHGDVEQSERILRFALARNPDSALVMHNLVPVLEKQGKHSEAATMAAALAKIEPHPAFEFFDKGIAAMRLGDYSLAYEMFNKEVRRAPYYHEFHFWLAVASLQLGQLRNAREELDLARLTSTRVADTALYEAKLAHLRSLK